MTGKEIGLIAGSMASIGVSVGMPISSLYKSGQENRGVISSGLHLGGAAIAGTALSAGLSYGTMALTGFNAADIAAKMASKAL